MKNRRESTVSDSRGLTASPLLSLSVCNDTVRPFKSWVLAVVESQEIALRVVFHLAQLLQVRTVMNSFRRNHCTTSLQPGVVSEPS